MFTIDQLEVVTKAVCSISTDQTFETLKSSYGFQIVGTGADRFAIRIGTVPVVAVCHLDTVLGNTTYDYNESSNVVTCSELDDRLGLACLLLLATIHDFTIVCCDHEEVGQSTADVAADYIKANGIACNWIFELDRRGLDVVSYDYSEPLWDGILETYFGEVGQGSFSDVCRMESLGVKALNAAIGYHREHTLQCHADLNDTLQRCTEMSDMLTDLAHVRLPHVQQLEPGYRDFGTVRDFGADHCDECQSCQSWEECEEYMGMILCDDCWTTIKTGGPFNAEA